MLKACGFVIQLRKYIIDGCLLLVILIELIIVDNNNNNNFNEWHDNVRRNYVN